MGPHPGPVARRDAYDFTDYLDARRRLDNGDGKPQDAALAAVLEKVLPVPFAASIPHLGTFEIQGDAHPRNLRAEDIAVVFRLREDHARVGEVRASLHGTDLPEPPALGDWLDFFETEREAYLTHREKLRKMDAKLYGIFTGARTNPRVDAATVAAGLPR